MTFLLSLLGGIPAMLMRGLGSLWALLAKLSPMQIALAVVTVAGVGFHIADLRHIRRVEAHDASTSRALGKERDAHAADIARWKVASETATALNKAQIARVATQQSTITKDTTDAYQANLAALRARLGVMRAKAGDNQRPANGDRASPVSDAASPVNGEKVPLSDDDLLLAAETELQLNALIDWNRKQSEVDPNAKP